MSLQQKWEKYEGEVKELLEWIMSEADSFSKDVTTYGEKGIVDHMETCKVCTCVDTCGTCTCILPGHIRCSVSILYF